MKRRPLVARLFSLSGQVQGVGFRPFVYRLAQELGVKGWVKNITGRVEIHAEAGHDTLEAFALGLIAKAPPLAKPHLVADMLVAVQGSTDFRILDSDASTEADIHLPPDNFVCPECLAEMQDPSDRRYRYPFINCTQCGPRYTLIEALPYDRPNTSMRSFPLCPACRAEYEDPGNRRFHAEPVACPLCGPHLEFVDQEGSLNGNDADALAASVTALRAGKIVAVKGIGGYHLMCDAGNDAAVAELRQRKPRPAKPLAVMFPADGELLARTVRLEPAARALLESPARPIVLAEWIGRHAPPSPTGGGAGGEGAAFARSEMPEVGAAPFPHPGPLPQGEGNTPPLSPLIAPGLGEIGCFLPYSPLHHLLLADFGGPLVATSGNISGEPVLTDNDEAETRLAHIADAFLHHDRPIVRPADDSVYRPIAGRPRPLRLGRGTAPLELQLPNSLAEPVLALGSHMKNTICLAWQDRAVLSPHIGELDTARSLETLARVAEDLQRLYQVKATRLLLDHHPGYGYRRWARETGLAMTAIWHHHAHASALAWEFPEVTDWITFAWDGVGLGEDGSLWGGEALIGGPGHWRRAASFRPFRLPGGEKAGREPWRSAAALLWEVDREAAIPGFRFTASGLQLLRQAWQKGINSPVSSAAGRLFDAAAALSGICSQASFEGEGPMRLEAAATPPSPLGGGAGGAGAAQQGTVASGTCRPLTPTLSRGERENDLPLSRDDSGLWLADWAPLLPMLADAGLSIGERAARFHSSLASALVDQALRLREETGCNSVGLTGGVFQNRLLSEQALAGLEQAGFRVYLAERVPVNDAGVSFGQVIEFLHTHP